MTRLRTPRGLSSMLTIGLLVGLTALASGQSVAASDHVAAAHGTHTWTTTEQIVPVVTGPNDNIHLDIDTTLYRPDNATASHPQPAILMTHGFGLDKDASEVVSTARFFAAHGYV